MNVNDVSDSPSSKSDIIHSKSIIETLPCDGWVMNLFFLPAGDQKVVLLVIDIASGLILTLKHLERKEKGLIADALWDLICTYGPPVYIISDNGSEFVNAVLKKLLSAVGIEHRLIASYHPNANGKAERAVKD